VASGGALFSPAGVNSFMAMIEADSLPHSPHCARAPSPVSSPPTANPLPVAKQYRLQDLLRFDTKELDELWRDTTSTKIVPPPSIKLIEFVVAEQKGKDAYEVVEASAKRPAAQLSISTERLTSDLDVIKWRLSKTELDKANTPKQTQRKVGTHQIPPTTRHHSSTCGYGSGGGLKPACLKPRLMHSVFVPPKADAKKNTAKSN